MKTALFHIRIRCNYSQSMLARELDISRQLVCAWESGAKTIPVSRKEELSNIFGIAPALLDEKDECVVQKFCDRAVFSRMVQGRQVFSFKPMADTSGVFLESPRDCRPAERRNALVSRKKVLMDQIDQNLRFDPERSAEQLVDMEIAVAFLERFVSLLSIASHTEPRYQGRVLQFLLEQLTILDAAMGENTLQSHDCWSKEQLHLLRYRWAERNRQFVRSAKHPTDTTMEPDDPTAVLAEIDKWYQQAKHLSVTQTELQWSLNQLLEQENIL